MSAADEFYDVPATIVDPEAGRRAAAAIAAARGFGQHEVPTKESKNVVAALAEHERTLAEERSVAAQPTPSMGFDLQVDALQEIEPPTRLPLAQLENPFQHTEVPDRFDIPVATGSAPSPLRARPRGNGLTLLIVAVLAAVTGFAAFRFGATRLLSAKPAPTSAPAAR